MNIGEGIAVGVLGLFVIYLVARLISAAYFKSKQHYERTRQHGTQS